MTTANLTLTLRVNGVDSSLTVTINAGSTSASASGSVSVTINDVLSIKCVASATENNATANLLVAVY